MKAELAIITLFFCALVSSSPATAGESVSCPVIADTYVYATPWSSEVPEDSEAFDNHGGEAQFVLYGREYSALLQFDLWAVQGMSIEKATLRIHRNPNQWQLPVPTLGLSTISGAGPWVEGNKKGGLAERGTANYFYARAYEQPWAYAGSDLSDVTFGLGGSLYAYAEPRDVGGDWYEVDVPVQLVHALVTGDQYGLMLTDEKGQTRAKFSFHGRIQAQWPPVLIVEGTRSDTTAPGPVQSLKSGSGEIESTPAEARSLGRTTLTPGSVVLHFGGAGDDNGQGVATRYEVRYSQTPLDAQNFLSGTPVPRWMMNPLAPKPQPLATANALRDEVAAVVENLNPGEVYYFAARAFDEAVNIGPVSQLGRYRAYTRSYPALAAEAVAPPPQPPLRRRHAERDRRGPVPGVKVWAVPELMKIDPKTGELLERNDFLYHRVHNEVWSEATGAVNLTGARNEFVAFQLAIESAQPLTGIEVSVSEPLFGNTQLPPVFANTGAVQIYREWFVPDDADSGPDRPWYPDPLVPLSGKFDLPATDNAVPGQTVQPVFVDIYIPHGAQPGVHTGRLLVLAANQFRREITVQVQVLPLALPDKLNFIVDLNAYSGVNSGYNIERGTPEYRSLVRAYHRLAHLHRTNLDVLGYGHTGNLVPDYSPPLTGQGAATTVTSWADWDEHFGPLVDGSAFADLPRASVPVANLYLNFCEHWPGDIHTSYLWDNYPRPNTTEEYKQLITRHAFEAGPIEQGFSQEYQDRFSAVVRQFAEHFREKGWTGTRYLVYFNNKHIYKDPARSSQYGTSWWLLDEPNYRDDYRALSFFGNLTTRWLSEYPDVPITFRTDISYVDFMRDLLTGQIDLNCVSKRFFTRNRYLMNHRHVFGREFWNYGTTNHPRETNVSMRSWCWRVWASGGDGLLPWNAVRGSESWDRAEQLTVFYPGTKFGLNEPFGSLRLKAYRRGQQDVEYLIMLAKKEEWDRDAVSKAITDGLNLESAKDADLDNLRLRIANSL